MEVAFSWMVVTVATGWLLALGWRDLTHGEKDTPEPEPEPAECDRCGRIAAALERRRLPLEGCRPNRRTRGWHRRSNRASAASG